MHKFRSFRLYSIDFDKKPIILLSPDVRIQTESKKRKSLSQADTRKKSLIDSGIELLFKKNNKATKEASQTAVNHPLSLDSKSFTETSSLDGDSTTQRSNSTDEPSRWRIFNTIRIHTDSKHATDVNGEILIGVHSNQKQSI